MPSLVSELNVTVFAVAQHHVDAPEKQSTHGPFRPRLPGLAIFYRYLLPGGRWSAQENWVDGAVWWIGGQRGWGGLAAVLGAIDRRPADGEDLGEITD